MFDLLDIFKDRKKYKKLFYIICFILPILVMTIIFIVKGIYPFSERSFLRTDMYHQYLPFHEELQTKLKSFGSLFYTYKVGLGTNFLTLFAYYLASPFNILLFFISDKHVIEFVTYVLVLKIGLSSLFMSIYLSYKHKSTDISIIICSVFFALSGYIAAYSWNIMWIDTFMLFPLLILSFEKVFYKNKPFPYIVILALSILTNYYIATMECFFLIIYFIFLCIISNQSKIKSISRKFLHTGIYSLIGILISCILLVPVFYAFNTTASIDSSFPSRISEYFSFLNVFSRHLMMIKIENGLDHWPNIYSGILTFPLIVLYFMSKKFTIKEKLSYTVLLLFLMASFSINVLDYMWHIFKYPNSLPSRFSHIYVFIILTLCCKVLLKYKSHDDKTVAKSFILSLFIIFIIQKTIIEEYINFNAIYISIIFLIIYFIIFLCFKVKKYNKAYLSYVLLLVVFAETLLNMHFTSVTTIKRNDYVKEQEAIHDLLDTLKKSTDDFYRVERLNRKTKNDGAFLNFPSASIFSSSAYKEGSDFYKQMGMEAATNAYSITGSTPFMDAFLSVKYEIYNEKNLNDTDMNMRLFDTELVNEKDNVYLYQKLNYLPLSFVLDNDFLSKYDFSSGNPATNQNNFARSLDLKSMLEKQEISENGKEVQIKVASDGDYYTFVRDKGIHEVTVIYNTTTKTFKNLNRGYFIELGFLNKEDELTFRNDYNQDDLLIEVFRFNYENMKFVIGKILDNSDFKLNKITDTKINYDLDSKIDGTCMLSLPYDKGFKVIVDGKEVETKKVFDCFLGFDVSEGNHNIRISYMPEGFILGLILSLMGIILMILLFFAQKYYKKKQLNIYEI